MFKFVFIFLFVFDFFAFASVKKPNKKTKKVKTSSVYSIYNSDDDSESDNVADDVSNPTGYNDLGLLDVVNIALANNPKVKQQWLNVKVSKEDYNIKKSTLYPSLNGSVGYTNGKREYNKNNPIGKKDNNLWNAGIELSYLLLDFGRGADIDSFKYRLTSIQYDSNSYIRDFIYDVIKAYYGVLSAMANETAARESEKSSFEALKAAETRYKVGYVALTDKLQSETQYSKNILNRKKAENNVKNSKARLNYLLNLSPTDDLKLREIQTYEINNEKSDVDINTLIDVAVLNRTELKSLEAKKKSKESEILKNRAAHFPKVNFQAKYGMDGDLKNRNTIGDESNNNWSVSVVLSVPFFTGGSVSSGVEKSRVELDIINEQSKDFRKNIELDVWTTYQDFMTAKQSYDVSEVVLKSAREAEKNILGKYKNGKSSMLDLLNAQSTLSSAMYDYINSQYEWFIQRANLIRAIGTMEFEEMKM